MPKLLRIVVMDLIRTMRHLEILPRLGLLEEKRMMIRKLHSPINMKESGDRLVILIHNVRHSKSKLRRVEVKHCLICPGGVRYSIMSPAMHERRTQLETLELALPRFLVLIVYQQLR